MTIEEGFMVYLLAYPGLSALVSTKIYPLVVPQSIGIPSITYTKLSEDNPRDAISGHSGLINVTYQFSIFAKTYLSMSAIAVQLNAALKNYSGLMGAVFVQGCFLINETELYDNNTLEYARHIDYQFTY